MHRFFKRKAPEPEEQNTGNITVGEFDFSQLRADPGLRIPICSYNANIRDQVRRIYLQKGPCQPSGYEFPKRKFRVSQFRRFNPSWFKEFGDWLEYSIEKDAAYCLYCYLFKTTKGKQAGGETFVSEGFTNWKGKDRLNIHVGQHDSEHHKARMNCEALMNPEEHIQSILHKQSKQIRKFCCDKGIHFGVMMRLKVLLIRLTSLDIQKDIVRACATKTINVIIKDIGNSLFSILVDESHDVSMKEQMSVVLRYVDSSGHINERFIGIEHVTSTTTLSLKAAIDKMFAKYNLSISNVRGQGFDGASNMQALIAVAKKNLPISNFFRTVGDVVNVVGSSCKRSDLLKDKHSDFIVEALEREDDSSSPDQKTEAFNLLESILSFDFAFNLHLIKHVLGISSELSTTLQKKDQDIVNAMDLVQLYFYTDFINVDDIGLMLENYEQLLSVSYNQESF
ncbi:uncharacterized protein LOC122028988 [Zingiber officinale]|uniref:uncharacterized protein LOC122028988 n=1 Tax=Zingiber officinale TaxID=94328 RepID=UPI001C4B879F|nr:uncharacterized protein LOC122028988 [Zingiber officinale]